jgi:hypothetical protein
MSKIIIINWSFESWKEFSQKTLEDNSNSKYIRGYKYYEVSKSYFISYLKEIIKVGNSTDEFLILLHERNGILNNDIYETINNNNRVKVHHFEGTSGTHKIYEEKGLLGSSDFRDLAIQNFDFVWDWYWNKLDLENHKKHIINLWLPLAIDIQGLSEVKDEKEKAEKYFEGIKKENEYLKLLKLFTNNKEGKNEDFPLWDEIKGSLSTEYQNFDPTVLVSAIKSTKDFSSFESNCKQYLESKIGDNPNPNFLPNWLQEVVGILDKKINVQNQPESK